MKITRILIALSLLGLMSACGGPGESAKVPEAQPAGATNQDIGDHVVHFNAMTTDQLTPEIARAYDFVRSKNRAMLNVSVVNASDNTSVAAEVTVKAVNLTGQLKNVPMRRIQEQEAIYYIGEVAVANRETLIFDISVTPEGADSPSEVRFKRQFFTD
jgi:DNA-directed RNA polymerase specialized sigma54-like protein